MLQPSAAGRCQTTGEKQVLNKDVVRGGIILTCYIRFIKNPASLYINKFNGALLKLEKRRWHSTFYRPKLKPRFQKKKGGGEVAATE